MHPYSKRAIELKDNRFKQDYRLGDFVYLNKTNDYLQILTKNMVLYDYIKIPSLATVISNLTKRDFKLSYKKISDEKELWFVDDGDIHIEEDNIWMALTGLWLKRKEEENVNTGIKTV